jgi:hypothetical protein
MALGQPADSHYALSVLDIGLTCQGSRWPGEASYEPSLTTRMSHLCVAATLPKGRCRTRRAAALPASQFRKHRAEMRERDMRSDHTRSGMF